MSKDEMREPVFWILTTLTQGRQHGYGIIRKSTALSGGSVTLAVTTLYSSLERLEEEGLIRSDGEEVVDGRLRRYYVLTPAGSERLLLETDRLEAKVSTVRSQFPKRSVAALGNAS